jgi:hypothetical protein
VRLRAGDGRLVGPGEPGTSDVAGPNVTPAGAWRDTGATVRMDRAGYVYVVRPPD